MKIKSLTLLALLSASVTLFAQEKEAAEKFKYSNITEFGFTTVSPIGFAVEGTTVQGFSLSKMHHIGLGIGIGGTFHRDYEEASAYVPIFVNYRCYFKPDRKFSPHANAALGGMMTMDGGGLYSAITMGFRAGKFSFSSGVSFMAVYRKETRYDWFDNGYWDNNTGIWVDDPYAYGVESPKHRWYFPFGIVIKCGFAL